MVLDIVNRQITEFLKEEAVVKVVSGCNIVQTSVESLDLIRIVYKAMRLMYKTCIL